jgi:flagellar basal body-associated protein FliL
MAKSGSIVPFIILLIAIAILAVVGFVAYSIAHDVGHKTRQKLEKKHVSFSRDGMKVGVKEVSIEQQEDATQRYTMIPCD